MLDVDVVVYLTWYCYNRLLVKAATLSPALGGCSGGSPWSQLRCWAMATTLATVVTWTWGWSDHDRRGSGPKQLSHHHNNKQPHCGIQQTEGKLVKESSQQL